MVRPCLLAVVLFATPAAADDFTVRMRARCPGGVCEVTERWDPRQTAVIVCDVWDAHHCRNAVRRVEEMAPRLAEVLDEARRQGALIVHAPSGCMAAYKDHPGRKLAQVAPKAANLPRDIGRWCHQLPAEAKGAYPVDQTDGGEDDDPVEHAAWVDRLAGMGRDPKTPWVAQSPLVPVRDGDAVSDSGVEIWNLLEHRGVRNVVLAGVHTNMCVLGRPFGLRRMAENGKNVVLLRDLTDTMYNPARWPFVTHFAGTDRVVEHIEKYVCPTVTSADFVGGEPFRFRGDRRNVVLMLDENEYKTEETLPAFAKSELESRGFRVTTVLADRADGNRFPGLAEAVRAADVLVVSVRRRTPPPAELDAVRAHVAAGKPLVGVRTASHAFAVRGDKPPPAGRASWPDFDPAVLGGHYTGHHGNDTVIAATVAPGAADHPVLRGVDVAALASRKLYKSAPLATSTTPLLTGTIPGQRPEPVAWTNAPAGGGRVFYTSLGTPEDFGTAAFRRLLLNGICWAADTKPPVPDGR
jgi:type 1 glutamine amidotransferase/nicotinamidase-related amidase